ncbi:LOW QUALITY PROTEIN: hypothetical protein YC2023_083059 [Brassica napus]
MSDDKIYGTNKQTTPFEKFKSPSRSLAGNLISILFSPVSGRCVGADSSPSHVDVFACSVVSATTSLFGMAAFEGQWSNDKTCVKALAATDLCLFCSLDLECVDPSGFRSRWLVWINNQEALFFGSRVGDLIVVARY